MAYLIARVESKVILKRGRYTEKNEYLLIARATGRYTLDSGINVAPGITVAPPLKNFHIMILILFYTNLGIAIIFEFFLSSKFFKN